MILRAIIENKEDLYHYRIRIPVINKAQGTVGCTDYNNLYIATVCSLPGISPTYAVGDVVFVGFEKDLYEYPVILGLLYREQSTDSVVTVTCDSLTSNNETTTTSVTTASEVFVSTVKLTDQWLGTHSPFWLKITLNGVDVTPNTKVDIQLDLVSQELLASYGCKLIYIVNDNAELTCYVVGAFPTACITIQVTCYEVAM